MNQCLISLTHHTMTRKLDTIDYFLAKTSFLPLFWYMNLELYMLRHKYVRVLHKCCYMYFKLGVLPTRKREEKNSDRLNTKATVKMSLIFDRKCDEDCLSLPNLKVRKITTKCVFCIWVKLEKLFWKLNLEIVIYILK